MVKCKEGTVTIDGDTLTITAELAAIIRTLLDEDFPMEGIELAIKLAENEVVVSDYGA